MKTPQHIAFICDGNRRWAKKKGKSEFSGHKYATDHTVEDLVDHSLKLKIPYLTFWVLSTENWQRGKTWMQQYFKLMHYFFDKKLETLVKKGAKIITSGDLSPFPKDLQIKIQKIIDQSKNNKNITINIAINYGGYDEITRAVNKLIEIGKPITEKDITDSLDTRDLPNPDLLIRTGESNDRLSGFMLWQTAYSPLYFSNILFPDFSKKELDKAILWWQTQTQNLGK